MFLPNRNRIYRCRRWLEQRNFDLVTSLGMLRTAADEALVTAQESAPTKAGGSDLAGTTELEADPIKSETAFWLRG